jgi:hypothetical protein
MFWVNAVTHFSTTDEKCTYEFPEFPVLRADAFSDTTNSL